MNNLQNEVVSINKKLYKVSSVIFHHGQSIEHGHYTNMIYKNGIWFKVSDTLIQSNALWPENVKDVYMIFQEQFNEQSNSRCENTIESKHSTSLNHVPKVKVQRTIENKATCLKLSQSPAHEIINNSYSEAVDTTVYVPICNSVKEKLCETSSDNIKNITQINCSQTSFSDSNQETETSSDCTFLQQSVNYSKEKISQNVIDHSSLPASSAMIEKKQKRFNIIKNTVNRTERR